MLRLFFISLSCQSVILIIWVFKNLAFKEDEMKKEEVNLLTLKKYHKILSKLTGKIYIDKNAKCYLFESDYEAEQFCSQLEETFYDKAQCYKAVPFVFLLLRTWHSSNKNQTCSIWWLYRDTNNKTRRKASIL